MKCESGGESRIPSPVSRAESPLRHLPLVDLLVDTTTELLELALRSGLKVFTAMLEEDRTAICGPRYVHESDRPASRAGTTRSEVVLGGRKVAIQRPRVRSAAGEVAVPTFEAMALGIAADGQKHALGLWDGSTENATVCQGLLANLQSRGLRTDRSLLVILDGSKALRKAVRATFGDAALVQRCQVHKMRNILEYLNDRQRPWAQAILRRAYQSTDVKTAQRLLLDLARRLETDHPSAAESVREGLEEGDGLEAQLLGGAGIRRTDDEHGRPDLHERRRAGGRGPAGLQ